MRFRSIEWSSLTIWSLMALIATATAEEFPTTCLSPDNENPEIVLRYVLDAPADGSRRDIGHCLVQPDTGYPPYRLNPKRPNVFRGYRIVSVADGKPHKGQATKRIHIEFDYVAIINERYPDGKTMCKPWPAVIAAYHTERGWIVSQPGDGDQFVKLRSLLDADRKRLDQAYAANRMGSIKELSTRIETLSIAADRCTLPPQGDWK